jgi:peptide/nickel transport system ATP-binding protein
MMAAAHQFILRARAVQKSYPVAGGIGRARSLRALRGVDLDVLPGEIVGIVGESGCGKSTLARLLLGVEQPTEGEITVEGRALSSYARLERARLVQPVFQDPYSSLNPRMRIGATIAAPLDVQGYGTRSERRTKVLELMEVVGLSEHLHAAFPDQLSGGQRQRVAIARSLIARPRILILDEPTSALDVSVQSQILNLVARLHRELNLTIILISHNLAVVQHLADRVAVMYLGQIVEQASSNEIFATPRHPYTKSLLDAVLVPRAGKGLPRLDAGGEVPSPLDPPFGCAFHPRCPRADEICGAVQPDVTAEAGARWRCHFPLDACKAEASRR